MTEDIRRVESDDVYETLAALKAEGYNVLVDLTAVDYSGRENDPAKRFEVVYRLMKLDATSGMDGGRVEVHCRVGEEPELRSAAPLWPIADWLEREIWDMFGVGFTDRPNIKRLLMYDEFVGHALRKDYPIAQRQPLIGPPSGEKADSPSFNILRPTIKFE